MLTTTWEQEYPYNAQINYICGDERAPAGYVAIATGQILTYYKQQPINNPNAYNYELFCNYTSVPSWDVQAVNEVARFIKDIGIDANMEYGCYVSGANSAYTVENVIKNKYGLGTSLLSPMYHPLDFLGAFVNDRVIYARGQDPNYGGHAWVIDGGYGHGGDPAIHLSPLNYSVHCNFGWNGISDGWFLMATSAVNTGYVGSGSITVAGYNFQGLEGWVISK
ncbi:MAG: C10 family peptidase [Prevotellaceae bacterium]|nr:C10 family peptidase [Prevotellaceae bacterium]